MVDSRERYTDAQEPIRMAMDSLRATMWSAMPGIVVAYNAGQQTVQVQPAIQQISFLDEPATPLPLLGDVPVVFPGGGGFGLTFPISPGDECLLVFSSRAIDAWWQSGGVQPPSDLRMQSLSDGFALVGVRSRPRALTGVSGSAVQLRNTSGTALVEMAAGGAVRIVAPGGLTIVGNAEVQGALAATGNVTGAGISLNTHQHTGVDTGPGNTGGPI